MKTTKAEALGRLRRAVDAIPDLKPLHWGSPEFEKWHRNTEIAIANTFGESSRHVTDFTRVGYSLMMWTESTTDAEGRRAYVGGLDSAASVLLSMIEEVEEYWEHDTTSETAPNLPSVEIDVDFRDVFVIHGRDGETKENIARFLGVLNLNPIILHEQANEGRTLIEKFERHAQVGFAVALLTPDDVGSLAEDTEGLKPRARQNVVLELGYFMGRLGRDRVCALVKGGVEVPSDIAGVVYIPLDIAGAWKMALVRELKASGFDVDANLAL